MMRVWLALGVATSASLVSCALGTTAQIVINEIADKGTLSACNGEDWVELYNYGDTDIHLGTEGYILHDDNGKDHEKAFHFPVTADALLAAQSYMLLCHKQKIPAATLSMGKQPPQTLEAATTSSSSSAERLLPDPMSPQFGLSGDDTVTLMRAKYSANSSEVSTSRMSATFEVIDTVELPNTDDAFDITYARDTETGRFNYTSTPTPGTANLMTRIPTPEEQIVAHKQALREQEAMGRQFFNMDERGYPVPDPMDTVLNLTITMSDTDYRYMMENQTFEQYRPFQSGQLTTTDGRVLLSLDNPGRVRPKGQSGLFVATCLDTPSIPFQIDMHHTNKSQTLFGVERVLLRHHAEDYSFSREWAYYRMLARFGMPYLRSRKVNFYIQTPAKTVAHGFYTLMEAPEHEYVFARNFPDYNPEEYGLYKFKSLAKGCGDYTQEELKQAEQRLQTDVSTPPYAWERGEHKKKVEVKNPFMVGYCRDQFVSDFIDNIEPDIVLAYLRHDQDCSEMLTEEGLIERDLGTKDFDKDMKRFIDNHLGPNKCDAECANSNLKEVVDTENWLKMFAFYATALSLDSPISFHNNYYLAQSGDNAGWKIVPYDLNARQAVGCNNDICNGRLVHWSVARPTCESLESNQLVGPLLTDPDLHAEYMGYVREFVDTIYGNETTWKEISTHIAEISDYAKNDFWSAFGIFHDEEINPPAEDWNTGQYPLLAVMKARTADLRAQLDAAEAETLARAPHVGVVGGNEPWETCADWRLEQPNTTRCEMDCQYEGCHMPGWTVESFCDEGTGVCYHGDADPMCHGVPEGERYPGMQDGEDGKPTYCRMAKGVPVKASECPAVGEFTPATVQTTSDAVQRGMVFAFAVVLVIAGFVQQL
ncbi:spore coat protein CotH [Seminavis robusta]|uniref:Spore coat protein CotH n=1 Tax=Seminavis robusta TaxID=568900 RepID=A0A9N8E5P9_9STRA|nr:spore coat protein CotH [Seminavis robusta]|eukprot:Sro542_g163370.1 spore coat protein CotH (877) ;mRNA; r:29699-32418